MSKRRRLKKRHSLTRRQSLAVDLLLDETQDALQDGDYENVIRLCRLALDQLPRSDKRRVEALQFLASALATQKRFDESYDALLEAVNIDPDEPILWYNKSLSALYTSRIGQALRDAEKAVALDPPPQYKKQFQEQLAFIQDVAEKDRALRGPDFTIEQLIEQQDIMKEAMLAMEADRWLEAEQSYRKVIAMGDCLPQPWGNLGLCLMMQRRFDEAEAAFNQALELDPDYELAKRNLKLLPSIRKSGQLPEMKTTQPFADTKVRLAFDIED